MTQENKSEDDGRTTERTFSQQHATDRPQKQEYMT